MLFENSHCKRPAFPAALLIVLACLVVGCETKPELSVTEHEQPTAPASGGSVDSLANQSLLELPKASVASDEPAVSEDRSPEPVAKLESPTEAKDRSSKPGNVAGQEWRADQKTEPPIKAQPSTKEETEPTAAKNESVAQETIAPKTEPAEKKKSKYTDLQLHKNHTTLLLAAQPDLRAQQLLIFVHNELTVEQLEQSVELILKEDHHYQRLIKRRQEVLNVATDGDETEEKLRQIKVETLDLSARLRRRILKEILTREQKEHRRQMAEQRRAEAKEAAAKEAAAKEAAAKEAESKEAESKEAESKEAAAKEAEFKEAEAKKEPKPQEIKP